MVKPEPNQDASQGASQAQARADRRVPLATFNRLRVRDLHRRRKGGVRGIEKCGGSVRWGQRGCKGQTNPYDSASFNKIIHVVYVGDVVLIEFSVTCSFPYDIA